MTRARLHSFLRRSLPLRLRNLFSNDGFKLRRGADRRARARAFSDRFHMKNETQHLCRVTALLFTV